MTGLTYRPLVALGLAASLLTYVGCSSSRTDSGPKSPATGSAAAPGSSSPAGRMKLIANWPTPAGALLISGEQFGYLEPCGCTQGQLGGLTRRYDLITWLRDQQHWPLVLLDLGSLIKDPAGSRGGFEQSKHKFQVALKAIGLMKYNALALSVEDLKLGTDEALMQAVNTLGEQTRILCANVVVAPNPAIQALVQPSLKAAAGPITVGITAVIEPGNLLRLADPARADLLPVVKPPEEVLPGVLASLEKETDVQVLMVQGPPELARALGEKFPGFDVVVGTSPSDPPEDAERLNDGKTLLVTIGQKGKYAGLIGLFQDPKQRLRYQRVTLGNQFNGPAKPIHDLIEDEFQTMLRTAGVVENFPRHDHVGSAPGARYVGVETCRSCHPNTVAKWATTKHAHAFEDIVKDPKGVRSDHQFDAECVSCHTTGFEYTSGWRSAVLTPYLKGNQCENCHGPASAHVANPDDPAIRKTIALTAAEVEHSRFCFRCHDEDNSPRFDFTTYWGQIIHKGLDQYTDPRVHQGLPPRVAREPAP
jgi:hypothetical protein